MKRNSNLMDVDEIGTGTIINPTEFWIYMVYGFINDVVSGQYDDVLGLGKEIFDGMLKLAKGEDVNGEYIRSISYGG